MILIRLRGGLGNQMFLYAFGRRLAVERGEDLLLDLSLLGEGSKEKYTPIRDFDLARFPIKARIASKNEVKSFFLSGDAKFSERVRFRLRNLWYRGNAVFIQHFHQWSLDEVQSMPSPLGIVGRWQSELYFEPIKKEILDTFNLEIFKPTEITAGIINSLQSDWRTSVAVHVRRGDYVTSPLFSKELGALSSQYYHSAINYIRENTDHEPVFCFISQDQEWCKREFKEVPHSVFVEQEATTDGYFSDMRLIGLTDWSILSNSTFAWWGAYLGTHSNKKHILVPSRWAINDQWVPPNINPTEWTVLPSKFEGVSDVK